MLSRLVALCLNGETIEPDNNQLCSHFEFFARTCVMHLWLCCVTAKDHKLVISIYLGLFNLPLPAIRDHLHSEHLIHEIAVSPVGGGGENYARGEGQQDR